MLTIEQLLDCVLFDVLEDGVSDGIYCGSLRREPSLDDERSD